MPLPRSNPLSAPIGDKEQESSSGVKVMQEIKVFIGSAAVIEASITAYLSVHPNQFIYEAILLRQSGATLTVLVVFSETS